MLFDEFGVVVVCDEVEGVYVEVVYVMIIVRDVVVGYGLEESVYSVGLLVEEVLCWIVSGGCLGDFIVWVGFDRVD